MNPYFKHQTLSNPEFDIYKNAAHEIIEQRGVELYHLKRTIINSDLILGDTNLSNFEDAELVTMYIENYTSFDGSGNIFGSFGFEMTDQLVLLISKSGFDALSNTMEESDVLYHRISNRMFEILDVKDENSFFQFGRDSYWKKIHVKPFNKNQETFLTNETDIDAVDDIENTTNSTEMDIFETARELFIDEN